MAATYARTARAPVLLLLFNSAAASALASVVDGRVAAEHGTLWYRTYRKEKLREVPPLVVLHGGPQVPSDYLFPLSAVDEERAVVFYDQLGCGRSDAPDGDRCYGIEQSVADLRCVLRELGVADNGRFHLYGQSWGGLLAYLHLRDSDVMPRSLTLSNTPTSVPVVEAEVARLVEALSGSVDEFMSRHNCRTSEQPPELAAAYAHAGTSWRGTTAIAGLEVDGNALRHIQTPSLVMRGQHDFVTEACIETWRKMPNLREVVIQDASHHALLERPQAYLAELATFLCEHDQAACA